MLKLSVVLMLLVINISVRVQAEEPESSLAGRIYDEAKEAELAQRAQKRLYPGGRDESDLKVQAQLSYPVRKMAPSLTVTVDAEPAAED